MPHNSNDESNPPAWHERRIVLAIAGVLVAATLLAGVIGGIHRGLADQPDWRSFAKESAYVWQHRTIPPWTAMFGYLPAAFFALWPFTVAMPRTAGVLAFVTANVAATILCLWVLYRWWFMPSIGCSDESTASRRGNWRLFAWPLFLTAAHLQHALQANQLTIWLLLLSATGLTLVMRRREWAGGFLLGAAACLKVTPMVLGAYLLLSRRWRAFLAMAAAVIVLDIVPSWIFLGGSGAAGAHRDWYERTRWFSAARLIEDPWLRVSRHGNDKNCSVAVVLARWLRAQPKGDRHVVVMGDVPPGVIDEARTRLADGEHLTIDPMPPEGGGWSIERYEYADRSRFPRFSLADLPPRVVWWAWLMVMLTPAVLLSLHTLRATTGAGATAADRSTAALWLLMAMWLSPMVRDYYLALALPAVVVLCGLRLCPRSAEAVGKSRIIASVGLVAFYASTLLVGWNAGNWYGLHLLSILVLGVATVSSSRSAGRRMTSLTGPPMKLRNRRRRASR